MKYLIKFFVKFYGRNYPFWEFHFRMFEEGKELFEILDGSQEEPADDKEKAKWKRKNARIIT